MIKNGKELRCDKKGGKILLQKYIKKCRQSNEKEKTQCK